MNSLSHTNNTNKNKRAKTIITVVGVIVFLLVLSWTSIPALLFGAGSSGFSSLWSSLSTSFEDKQSLVEQNRQLQNRLDTLDAQVRAARGIAREYSNLLKEQLVVDIDSQVVPVVSRPPYTPYDVYIIDVSQVDGIERDQLVISDGTYVVGYVESISGTYATVRLFSATDLESVMTVGGALYEARGEGGGIVELSLPRNERDSQGKIVRLPGVPNYTVGTIIETEFDPQDSFVRGIVQMGPNVYTDELVSVSKQMYVRQEVVSEINENVDEEADDNTQ